MQRPDSVPPSEGLEGQLISCWHHADHFIAEQNLDGLHAKSIMPTQTRRGSFVITEPSAHGEARGLSSYHPRPETVLGPAPPYAEVGDGGTARGAGTWLDSLATMTRLDELRRAAAARVRASQFPTLNRLLGYAPGRLERFLDGAPGRAQPRHSEPRRAKVRSPAVVIAALVRNLPPERRSASARLLVSVLREAHEAALGSSPPWGMR